MKTKLVSEKDYSIQIAHAIKESIVSGHLPVDGRLPSESDLAAKFDVSRSTVREALKRLAAQNLIRTQRGASGGAFVNRISFAQAQEQLATTATLLLTMNEIDFETACESRFTLEHACLALACARRTDADLATMKLELEKQSDPLLSDESFCASDVGFHRALVDAAHNPILSWQLAASVEAMQPLMNMITYTGRSRARILDLHGTLYAAIRTEDAEKAKTTMDDLASYILDLGRKFVLGRATASPRNSGGRSQMT
jgi:GntR family transcriptional repressor for pyruvate dehydrogenase complex